MSRMTDYCDIACDVCWNWVPGTAARTRDQRRLLKAKGWVFRAGKDICPHCQNKATPQDDHAEN